MVLWGRVHPLHTFGAELTYDVAGSVIPVNRHRQCIADKQITQRGFGKFLFYHQALPVSFFDLAPSQQTDKVTHKKTRPLGRVDGFLILASLLKQQSLFLTARRSSSGGVCGSKPRRTEFPERQLPSCQAQERQQPFQNRRKSEGMNRSEWHCCPRC